jgi:hypothetical protein
MKKLFAMFVVAGMVGFVACGPSAEEKAAKDREDSIKYADSITLVEQQNQLMTDSITKADAQKAIDDSIANADKK